MSECKYTFVTLPTLEEKQAELEAKFIVTWFARIQTVHKWDTGTNVLTQYSPMFIEIRWAVQTIEEYSESPYSVLIAKNDHTKPYYTSPIRGDTWQGVLNAMQTYAKPRTAEQMRLF